MHWREASGKMTEVKHTRNIFFFLYGILFDTGIKAC